MEADSGGSADGVTAAPNENVGFAGAAAAGFVELSEPEGL